MTDHISPEINEQTMWFDQIRRCDEHEGGGNGFDSRTLDLFWYSRTYYIILQIHHCPLTLLWYSDSLCLMSNTLTHSYNTQHNTLSTKTAIEWFADLRPTARYAHHPLIGWKGHPWGPTESLWGDLDRLARCHRKVHDRQNRWTGSSMEGALFSSFLFFSCPIPNFVLVDPVY